MKKSKCLFCSSIKCYHRIVSMEDDGKEYDEVACRKHSYNLDKHSDEVAPGVIKLFISSTGPLHRGDSITEMIEEFNSNQI